MAKKKTLLVLLLVISLVLMVVIVSFIKTKFGYFGYSYHQYIDNMALQYDAAVETNMGRIDSEIKYLSKDNLVKNVFESSSRGEDTMKYYDDFNKIRNSIQDCRNLQVLDHEGNIIFSTETNEINNLMIITPIMTAVKNHIQTNDFTYIYMKDKDSLAAFYSVEADQTATTNGGFVVIYYKMSRLFSGIAGGQIIADGAISNMLITSRNILNDTNINYLMNYLKNPESFKTQDTNEKSVYVVRKNIHGIQVLFFPSNERYIPVLGLVLLITCLLLFVLVVAALIMVMRDEKIISDMPVKPIKVNVVDEYAGEKPDEIKTLIDDIEGNRIYGENEAQKGIEDMIMANGIDLTEGSFGPSSGEPEKINIEEPSKITENPYEEINTYDEIKPSSRTDLFAEEERILGNIESMVPYKEERSARLEDLEEDNGIVLSESFNEPEFPAFEAPRGGAGEPAAFEMPDMPELKEVPEEILKAEEIKVEVPEIELPEFEIPVHEADAENDAGTIAMMEPPQKTSSILTVEDFGKIAVELARKSLNVNKILILEKKDDRYIPIIKEGLDPSADFKIMANDPIFTMFLSGGKGLDIKGNMSRTRYFNERFDSKDIEGIDEIFITPIIKNREITGIAIYLKAAGIPDSTHYQKSELLNLSFLQDQ
jgi:hypothetical protein